MGVHTKVETLKIISFLQSVGAALGYHVRMEEPMFPMDKTSPILDMTWRKATEPYPLFIFEVESIPTKAAADNVIKIFSRRTEVYPKPLFLFHIFVEQRTDTGRIAYLKENYDKINYDTYLLVDEESQFSLLSNILNQHFRVASSLDLQSLALSLEVDNPLSVSPLQVLTKLVELGYDRMLDSNFVTELEELMLSGPHDSVRQFYKTYLPKLLSYETFPLQTYDPPFLTASVLSEVVHCALVLLICDEPGYNFQFAKLRQIEERMEPFTLWEPCFGISSDGDFLLLSEYPLALTMLCAAFARTEFSAYFSKKLKSILSESGPMKIYNLHGYVWLLIASQIARDEESYEFARSTINSSGGVSLQALTHPLVYVVLEKDFKLPEDYFKNMISVPSFQDWPSLIAEYVKTESVDLLSCIIGSFLVMDKWEDSRTVFARYCLKSSIVTRKE